MWQNERWISKGKRQGMAKVAEPQHSGRGIPMPYAVVRSQFAENLQVTAPYGRGWSLLAWWPFFPLPEFAHRSKCPPSAASYRSCCIFYCLEEMSLHLLLRHSQEGGGGGQQLPLYVLRLCFLCTQRLQKYLSNITVRWRFSVASRKGMTNSPQAIHYWQSVW